MGSRIRPREQVRQLFECFCEVEAAKTRTENAQIIRRFPESYKEEEVLKSIPQFAFPCEFPKPNDVVQHFSFVLTNIDSKWTFGFCRLAPGSATALVILSFLPWHEVFYKLLNQLAELTQLKLNQLNPQDVNPVWTFLDALSRVSVPDPGVVLQVPFEKEVKIFTCNCPDEFSLPSIPESRNLTEYVNAIDVSNMLTIFASLLFERRILVVSSRLSRLSACVQAANALLYPMHWQHIFIPVLPAVLHDYLLAPMPYLIGVPQPIWRKVRRSELGDVVVVDADRNRVETPFQDVQSLPPEVLVSFRRRLRSPDNLLRDGVARAFLRALVQLIGGYRDALRFHQGAKITFDHELFVLSRPSNLQPFLRSMLHLQIFQQFIEERLDILNSGQGFSDEFELEAYRYSEKESSRLKQQYREWLSTVRKEGGAFFKNVKNKANPAVKSAVKTVKERGKSAYKDIKSRFRDLHSRDEFDAVPSHDPMPLPGSTSKPHSAPSSPTTKQRPITIATTSYRREGQPFRPPRAPLSPGHYNPLEATSPLTPGSPGEASSNSGSGSGSELHPPCLNLDLMNDLQDFLFRPMPSSSSSTSSLGPPVDRSLKPTRSFDSAANKDAFGQRPFVGPPSVALASLEAPPPPLPTMPPPPLPSMPLPEMTVTSSSSTSLSPIPPPSPPPRPRRRPPSHTSSAETRSAKVVQEGTHDLIRLDSSSAEEDFDPLRPNANRNHHRPLESSSMGSHNPLYDLHLFQSQSHSRDADLLREYGLDFSQLGLSTAPSLPTTTMVTANGTGAGLLPASRQQDHQKQTDPFGQLVDLAQARKDLHKTNWTTFD